MQIGIGLDPTLGLSFEQHREMAREAVRLGYDSMWTPAGLGVDAFHVCAQWWGASAEVVSGGLPTGISVVPVPYWTAVQLAATAGTVGLLTGGRFILGIGSGPIHEESQRQRFALPAYPPVGMMRDYLMAVRGLLAGESVEHSGPAVTLHGARLGFRPPRVPVYLGALGPQMVKLSGAQSDGVLLNWCTPEQIAWSRGVVAEGARAAGRDPGSVQVVEYIRVCVDDDEDAARRAFTRAMMGYALARPGANKALSYRGHFARMGFGDALSDLESRRDRGASDAEVIEAFPRDLLRSVGYYGSAAGAAAEFRRLAKGLDVAIVRVVPARPGPETALATMQACRPELTAH
ncbi:MAG TPA: LLM class flavin-dependent oxidoreductase [Chloroflexota bacterium]|nr:LLM class flavin-dependent oxidoreductase [Chloroflexota bacterium]